MHVALRDTLTVASASATQLGLAVSHRVNRPWSADAHIAVQTCCRVGPCSELRWMSFRCADSARASKSSTCRWCRRTAGCTPPVPDDLPHAGPG